jgi:hypothetical protein
VNISAEQEDDVRKAIELMRLHGATIIDPVNVTGVGDPDILENMGTLLRYNFRQGIPNYLSELKNTKMRSLKDLIEFNIKHADKEFHSEYSPDQNVFISVENLTNFTAVDYAKLYNKTQQFGGKYGIDAT